MPHFILPIEEIDESVKRPTVYHIAKDLISRLTLPTDIPIVFKGQAEQPPYANSTLGSDLNGNHNRYQGDAQITLEYEETDNETAYLSTPVDYSEHRPFLYDPALGLKMTPVYINKRVTINIQLSGTEKQTERWRANIKRMGAQGVISFVHTAAYHFPIPMAYMCILLDVHKLKEQVAPYGEEFLAYLNRITPPSQSKLTNLAGKNPVFAISETQSPIQGWSDFGVGAPTKEKDDGNTRYTLNFSYTYYYDCPETIVFQCPLTVHNQMIPPQWIKNPKPYELEFIESRGSFSQDAFNEFRYSSSANQYTQPSGGLKIPYFDDWVSSRPAPGYDTLMSVLVQLDTSDPTLVLDFDGLGEFSLSPPLAGYIHDPAVNPFKPNYAVINIQLQADTHTLMDMNLLYWDDQGRLRYQTPLDPRQVYHVVVTINTDAAKLMRATYTPLTNHGCFFKQWIQSVYPERGEALGIDATTCTLGSSDDSMSLDQIHQTMQKLGKAYDIAPWYLVAWFTIFTKRSDQ